MAILEYWEIILKFELFSLEISLPTLFAYFPFNLGLWKKNLHLLPYFHTPNTPWLTGFGATIHPRQFISKVVIKFLREFSLHTFQLFTRLSSVTYEFTSYFTGKIYVNQLDLFQLTVLISPILTSFPVDWGCFLFKAPFLILFPSKSSGLLLSPVAPFLHIWLSSVSWLQPNQLMNMFQGIPSLKHTHVRTRAHTHHAHRHHHATHCSSWIL